MTTTRRRIATALIAVATLGGVGLSTAAPAAAATSYRTAVGGPWDSFANCRNWLAIQAQSYPGSYGLCANTTYQGISGIFSVINYPLRSKN
ncbi:hypothetical protein [Serinibacter arcticus]|uniref:Secreted protein n=1 Tax=Serinibacter arcticus TaxID=1655435 RepID=A0A4Z1E090_9MICO|nr:hypothetical protein [Serinibacter arcticus]TGO05385.1 hypothetical protein SERN_1389 [Serinibacter arcticus]